MPEIERDNVEVQERITRLVVGFSDVAHNFASNAQRLQQKGDISAEALIGIEAQGQAVCELQKDITASLAELIPMPEPPRVEPLPCKGETSQPSEEKEEDTKLVKKAWWQNFLDGLVPWKGYEPFTRRKK